MQSWTWSRVAGAAVVTVASIMMGLVAAPAAAYVVVTRDNRVYDVPTKPEVRGDLVVFELDGHPVSLRVYEVNITKTNELNYLLDSGAGAPTLTAQLRQLKPAAPTDERIMVSSPLHQVMENEAQPDYRVRLEGEPDGSPSFRDSPGRQTRSASTRDSGDGSTAQTSFDRRSSFESEARQALDDADRQVRGGQASAPAARATSTADADRAADLDSEIAAEQAYLEKLTSGEEVVPDLERAIDSSMDKIRRLQKRRDRLGSASSSRSESPRAAASSYKPSGSYPAGSREAGWEKEIVDLQTKLQRLQGQQAGADGTEREMIDEVIGETEYRIDKLQRKLGGR